MIRIDDSYWWFVLMIRIDDSYWWFVLMIRIVFREGVNVVCRYGVWWPRIWWCMFILSHDGVNVVFCNNPQASRRHTMTLPVAASMQHVVLLSFWLLKLPILSCSSHHVQLPLPGTRWENHDQEQEGYALRWFMCPVRETWALKKAQEKKWGVAEMWMLKRRCGVA